jgi:hypothetical protein
MVALLLDPAAVLLVGRDKGVSGGIGLSSATFSVES